MGAISQIPEFAGKYPIKKKAGTNQLYTVFLGENPETQQQIVLKYPHGDLLRDEQFKAIWIEWLKTLRALNHHNVQSVLDIIHAGTEAPVIVGEWHDGYACKALFRRHHSGEQPLPLHLGLYIIAEACNGLEFLHSHHHSPGSVERGMVHHGISPETLLITSNGEVKISDHELAPLRQRFIDNALDSSPYEQLAYLAPEQLNGSPVDARSDVFSLGLILLELLTRTPLDGSKSHAALIRMVENQEFEHLRDISPQAHQKLTAILRTAISEEPEQRYTSANRMYMDVLHALILLAPGNDFVAELQQFINLHASLPAEAVADPLAQRVEKQPGDAGQPEEHITEDPRDKDAQPLRAEAGAAQQETPPQATPTETGDSLPTEDRTEPDARDVAAQSAPPMTTPAEDTPSGGANESSDQADAPRSDEPVHAESRDMPVPAADMQSEPGAQEELPGEHLDETSPAESEAQQAFATSSEPDLEHRDDAAPSAGSDSSSAPTATEHPDAAQEGSSSELSQAEAGEADDVAAEVLDTEDDEDVPVMELEAVPEENETGEQPKQAEAPPEEDVQDADFVEVDESLSYLQSLLKGRKQRKHFTLKEQPETPLEESGTNVPELAEETIHHPEPEQSKEEASTAPQTAGPEPDVAAEDADKHEPEDTATAETGPSPERTEEAEATSPAAAEQNDEEEKPVGESPEAPHSTSGQEEQNDSIHATPQEKAEDTPHAPGSDREFEQTKTADAASVSDTPASAAQGTSGPAPAQSDEEPVLSIPRIQVTPYDEPAASGAEIGASGRENRGESDEKKTAPGTEKNSEQDSGTIPGATTPDQHSLADEDEEFSARGEETTDAIEEKEDSTPTHNTPGSSSSGQSTATDWAQDASVLTPPSEEEEKAEQQRKLFENETEAPQPLTEQNEAEIAGDAAPLIEDTPQDQDGSEEAAETAQREKAEQQRKLFENETEAQQPLTEQNEAEIAGDADTLIEDAPQDQGGSEEADETAQREKAEQQSKLFENETEAQQPLTEQNETEITGDADTLIEDAPQDQDGSEEADETAQREKAEQQRKLFENETEAQQPLTEQDEAGIAGDHAEHTQSTEANTGGKSTQEHGRKLFESEGRTKRKHEQKKQSRKQKKRKFRRENKKKQSQPEGDEPILRIIEEPREDPDTSSRFYSIIEDKPREIPKIEPDFEHEEIKTIIDVVRISARRNKQKLLLTGVVTSVLVFLFAVIDIFAQITPLGADIYDIFFPPAIKIETIPSGAQVYLNDKPLQATTPLRLDEIPPGVHKLMLVLPSFDPIIKSINIPGSGELHIEGEEARPASHPYVFRFTVQLELSSQPQGATVHINGKTLAEKTPTTVKWEVSEQPIRIEMSRENFPKVTGLSIDPLSEQELIEDKRFWRFQKLHKRKQHFAIEGVFRKAVAIESIPEGAEIILNEEQYQAGITGLNNVLYLTPGDHFITLRKQGYLPRRFRLRVDENTPETITEVLPRYVSISAVSSRAGIDEDLVARIVELRSRENIIPIDKETPTELKLLPYTYTATLRKKGYKDAYVRISPNQREVKVVMEVIPAELFLTIVDSRTGRRLEGVTLSYKTGAGLNTTGVIGTTDSNGRVLTNLAPGFYRITAEKAGYTAQTKNLRIQSGRRNRLTFRLRRSFN